MRTVSTPLLAMALLALALPSLPAQSEASEDLVAASERFEFHSNIWLNQHHYLFNLAKQYEEKELGEYLLSHDLSEEEAAVFEEAAAYYRTSHIDNSLLFNRDLFAIKRGLIATPENKEVDLEGYPELTAHLRKTHPIYTTHFWPAHRSANHKVLSDNLKLVSNIENCAFGRIAELSQNQWPKHKVRVDITYLANWAGAYTTVDPITHAVIRSTDWESSNDWLEILFHEPGHAMISPDEDAIAENITKTANQLGIRTPRNLWHAMLFYVAGTAVKECLAEEGIEHELFMFRHGTFSRHHDALRSHMPDYVSGAATLERTIERMLAKNAR